MDLIEVRRRVAEVEALANDDEAAHSREDDLYKDVLLAIRDGDCVDAEECVRLALTTQDMDFSRWCA